MMIGTIDDLILATVAFVGGHFLLSSPAVRSRLIAQLGERRFAGVYSAVAGVGFVWLLFAFGAAPRVPLWAAPDWARVLPFLIVPLSAILFVCSLTQRNPTAVMQPLAPAGEDPAPGILKITRHPMMWAFGLWALAHIPINGHAAALILFGSLAILALGGTLAIDAKRRERDPEGFARLAAVTSNLPGAALLAGRTRMSVGDIGWRRLALGIALYVVLIFAHPLITGIAIY
jgi:uncharacterized membrane protein